MAKKSSKKSSPEKKVFYCCGIMWQHEVGATSTTFYESKEELIANHECAEDCGIVEVTMSAKWVVDQKPFTPDGNKKSTTSPSGT